MSSLSAVGKINDMRTGNVKEMYINMRTCIEWRNGRGKGIGEEITLPIYNDSDSDGDDDDDDDDDETFI